MAEENPIRRELATLHYDLSVANVKIRNEIPDANTEFIEKRIGRIKTYLKHIDECDLCQMHLTRLFEPGE